MRQEGETSAPHSPRHRGQSTESGSGFRPFRLSRSTLCYGAALAFRTKSVKKLFDSRKKGFLRMSNGPSSRQRLRSVPALLVPLALLLALVVAGCGGDDSATGSSGGKL